MEVRPRKKDFDNVLRAEVYDPLWMLGRQWQFGEFKGEDTGSAVFAKVALETTNISKFKDRNKPVTPYTDEVPLETVIEAENINFDYKTRVRVGQQWFKMLGQYGFGKDIRQAFIQSYPVHHPQISNTDAAGEVVSKSKLLSNHAAMQFVDAASGRSMDGYAFYRALHNDPATVIAMHFGHLSNTELAKATDMAGDFMNWFEQLYYIPQGGVNSSWNKKQLEYEFDCALPGEARNTVLKAEEYYNGNLDWFSFDIDDMTSAAALVNSSPEEVDENTLKRILTVIPSAAQFGGMPRKRWWEFEDAAIDLGNISADEKNLAKILITEFALVYSNDWFVIPYQVPVGSLSEITGIVVTDVFGQKTLVEAAGKGEQGDWNRWNMFSMTRLHPPFDTDVEADNRIFIPPVLTKLHESEPVELVKFMRDEMANMVWGVEDRVSDMLGGGMSGHKAAADLLEYLNGLSNEALEEEELAGVLKYTLANTVPENWIPFIPMHMPNDNRSIQLRRASMPRTLPHLYPGSPGQVRPRTDILRYGLRDDEMQDEPYDIFEEEVPRAGIQVIAGYQRARWYGGKTFVWMGRRKRTGRGQGSSGLRFDSIKDIRNNGS